MRSAERYSTGVQKEQEKWTKDLSFFAKIRINEKGKFCNTFLNSHHKDKVGTEWDFSSPDLGWEIGRRGQPFGQLDLKAPSCKSAQATDDYAVLTPALKANVVMSSMRKP